MLVTTLGSHLTNLERMAANHKVDGVILSRSVVKDRAALFLKRTADSLCTDGNQQG